MYVPQARSRYGYYVLPILRGDRIIGRADLIRDTEANTLRVKRVWWEPTARPVSLERAAHRLPAAVRGLP